jgi:hypothetical protein
MRAPARRGAPPSNCTVDPDGRARKRPDLPCERQPQRDRAGNFRLDETGDVLSGRGLRSPDLEESLTLAAFDFVERLPHLRRLRLRTLRHESRGRWVHRVGSWEYAELGRDVSPVSRPDGQPFGMGER